MGPKANKDQIPIPDEPVEKPKQKRKPRGPHKEGCQCGVCKKNKGTAATLPTTPIDTLPPGSSFRLNGRLYRKANIAGSQIIGIHLEEREGGLYLVNDDRVILEHGSAVNPV